MISKKEKYLLLLWNRDGSINEQLNVEREGMKIETKKTSEYFIVFIHLIISCNTTLNNPKMSTVPNVVHI